MLNLSAYILGIGCHFMSNIYVFIVVRVLLSDQYYSCCNEVVLLVNNEKVSNII